MSGLHAGCLTAAAVCLVGAFFVLAVLPAHPRIALPDRRFRVAENSGMLDP